MWVTATYLIVFSFLLLAFYTDFYSMKDLFMRNSDKSFMLSNSSDAVSLLAIPIPAFIVVAIITVVISFFHKETKYNFMLTEPISKDSIIITKTVGFILSYTIPIIIYGIISIIVLSYNSSIFGTHYSEIVRILLIRLFATFAILTFTTLAVEILQMLFGHSIAAVFVPNVLFYAFLIAMSLLYTLLSDRLQFLKDILSSLDTNITNVCSKLLTRYFLNYYVSYSIVLIAASALIFYIVLLLNRALKYEQLSKLLMFKFTEVITKVVFTLFIISAAPFIVAIIVFLILHFVTGISNFRIDDGNNIFETLLLILNFLWIPMFIFVYKLQTKIINKRRAS